ncbi:MAG: thioredoxin-disulfide reductase [Planctomycetota bacterium]
MRDLAIVGTGPAGWTAAIYAARGREKPVVLSGEQIGGQLMTTSEVENYPGFPEGIRGPALMAAMQSQAERFGAEVKQGCVLTALEAIDGGYRLSWDNLYSLSGEKETDDFRAVIIATGASARYLGLPGEAAFLDGSGNKQGLTACAVCDGAMPLYRDQPVCVVGGGDSACEEALFMTRYASKVYLIHRRDVLRASAIMGERAMNDPKIEILWNRVLTAYHTDDDGKMEAVELSDTTSGASERLAVKGVFMAIGHDPNTGFLAGSGIACDEQGFIEVVEGCRTSLPGVFAAGDVRDTVYQQAVTAAGMGCMAALEAEKYLDAIHAAEPAS